MNSRLYKTLDLLFILAILAWLVFNATFVYWHIILSSIPISVELWAIFLIVNLVNTINVIINFKRLKETK